MSTGDPGTHENVLCVVVFDARAGSGVLFIGALTHGAAPWPADHETCGIRTNVG